MNQVEKTFNHIMKTYGHNVLVLHQDKKTRCSCFDAVTGSASRSCPFCFGLGYVPIIKSHRTRNVDMSANDSLPFVGESQLFGNLTIANRSYYFHKNAGIKEHDLIIEVEWDGGRPVYTGRGIYSVSHVDPLRFTGGEISYYKIYVKDEPINKNIRGFKAVKKASGTTYQLAEGGM